MFVRPLTSVHCGEVVGQVAVKFGAAPVIEHVYQFVVVLTARTFANVGALDPPVNGNEIESTFRGSVVFSVYVTLEVFTVNSPITLVAEAVFVPGVVMLFVNAFEANDSVATAPISVTQNERPMSNSPMRSAPARAIPGPR